MEIRDQHGSSGPDVRDLMPLVYDELRTVAQRYLRRQPPAFTLRPTELVHEALIHLIKQSHADWTSTAHFRAIATRKIWQVVVDHLKRRGAQKRGGPAPGIASAPDAAVAPAGPGPAVRRRVPLDRVTVEWRDHDVDLLDLADALAELARESRRLHDTVMLHWFGGLTHAEVAAQLGVSTSTTEKDFRYALAWLNRRLENGSADGD